jgi:hypothetical protein
LYDKAVVSPSCCSLIQMLKMGRKETRSKETAGCR